MVAMIGPPLSGMMPMGPVPGMRPQMEGHISIIPESLMMRTLACPLMVLAQPVMTWPDR